MINQLRTSHFSNTASQAREAKNRGWALPDGGRRGNASLQRSVLTGVGETTGAVFMPSDAVLRQNKITCMCVVSTCSRPYVYAQGSQRTASDVFLCHCPPYFLRQVLSISQSLTLRPDWLASPRAPPASLQPSNTRVSRVHHHDQPVREWGWGWGGEGIRAQVPKLAHK